MEEIRRPGFEVVTGADLLRGSCQVFPHKGQIWVLASLEADQLDRGVGCNPIPTSKLFALAFAIGCSGIRSIRVRASIRLRVQWCRIVEALHRSARWF